MGKVIKNLKKPRFTPVSSEVEDIRKCMNDILYFAKKCMILTDTGLKPFEPYEWQEKLLRSLGETNYANKRRDIIAAARQTGKTTVIAIFFLWYAMFHCDQNLWIFANKHDMAKEILQRISEMYSNLPKHLRFETCQNSRLMIQFRENHSRIGCSALQCSSIVGRSLDYIWIDEAAFCNRDGMDEDFMARAMPVYSVTKTGMIFTSTPNGIDNVFYHIWEQAPENGFNKLKVTWRDIPGRDDEWARDQILYNGGSYFQQEYECRFLDSSL